MAMPGDAPPVADGPTPADVSALARALDGALDPAADGAVMPLGDPRQPEVIRAWAEITAAVPTAVLDDTLDAAVNALAADSVGLGRLTAAGIMPDVPVQIGLIAGYVRMFRRIREIAAAGGLDDAAMMAETRRDMRALNARMTEALGTIRDQRVAMARMNKAMVARERRQARTAVALSRAEEDLAAMRAALARAEAERDEARRAVAAVQAEREALRGDLKRARAGVEDLKARYLEKFALALEEMNRAREMLHNDPRSTLPAMKASVAQGYYMILEDMGAGEPARTLMARIAKDGF